jgi:hypothetical protein
MDGKEVSWTKLFALDAPAKDEGPKAKKCTCGNGSCKTAKGFVCRCSCKHLNHGIEQRKGMSPLDEPLGLVKEAPVPLGDLGLNRELSGLAELEGEI